MIYLLTRQNDGRVDLGSMTATFHPIFGYTFDAPPAPGCVFLVLDKELKGRQTSIVVEILKESDHKIVFKTLNSVYELDVCEGQA